MSDNARDLGQRPGTPQQVPSEQLEKDWQRTVVDLAKQLGWLLYHTHDSRRSAHGFPDLVLVRDRMLYLELKRDLTTSKLTDDQRHWLTRLRAAGADAYVARPRDLQNIAETLGSRGYSDGEHLLNQATLNELAA